MESGSIKSYMTQEINESEEEDDVDEDSFKVTESQFKEIDVNINVICYAP